MTRLLLTSILASVLVASNLLTGCAEIATGGAEITGLSLLHDRRTSKVLVQDEQIEINAAIKLNAVESIRQQCHFNITAYNGKVLATGEAPTEQLREDIVNIVRKIANVKEVHNHIATMAPSAYTTRRYDALITTKVKKELVHINNLPGFDATRVKVITERGRVYLMGLVRQIEADTATVAARKIPNVIKVIKVFEVYD